MEKWTAIQGDTYPELARVKIPYGHETGLMEIEHAKLMAAAPELLEVCELVLLHADANKALGATLIAKIQKAIDLALNKKKIKLYQLCKDTP